MHILHCKIGFLWIFHANGSGHNILKITTQFYIKTVTKGEPFLISNFQANYEWYIHLKRINLVWPYVHGFSLCKRFTYTSIRKQWAPLRGVLFVWMRIIG